MYIFVLLPLILSACNPFGGFRPTTDEVLEKNWAPDPKDPFVKEKPKKNLYCYKTLGDPVCYDQPLESADHEHRLIGKTADDDEKVPRRNYYLECLPIPIR